MKTIAEMEKQLITETLDQFEGNKTKAAASLGITIKTLYNKLHRYDLFQEYSKGRQVKIISVKKEEINDLWSQS